MDDYRKKKILVVFGTRPEAIKMAPVIKELKNYRDTYNLKVCVTGQHRQMLDQVLTLFEIVPDYDLNIMKSAQDLFDVSANVLLGLRNILSNENPDLVLVHGDTTTSMVAALAAFYQHIPVGHIEAGLRTNNIYSPWPEELNRQITGRIAKYHFAPTLTCKVNLENEGIKEGSIVVTGNTVIDALHWALTKLHNNSDLKEGVVENLFLNGIAKELLEKWLRKDRKLVLITGHRRENFGDGFISICEAIKELSNHFDDVDFVYPMHLNPNVRRAIKTVFKSDDVNGDYVKSNVFLVEPFDYLPFVYLMDASYLILTDSGGIQEEAPGLGKPVLVMRDTTERPEAVLAGTVKLVGVNKAKIISEVTDLLGDELKYNKMATSKNPYGDGFASKKIVAALLNDNRYNLFKIEG